MGWPIVWHLPVLILFRCFTVSTIDFFFVILFFSFDLKVFSLLAAFNQYIEEVFVNFKISGVYFSTSLFYNLSTVTYKSVV